MEQKPLVPDLSLPFNSLRLDELVLQVHLGCTAEERAARQEVRVTVELRFPSRPAGAATDNLGDTICYARIADSVRARCEANEYQLIERLAYDAATVIRELTGPGVAMGVCIHKVRPPVANLRGGTFFRCGDFAW